MADQTNKMVPKIRFKEFSGEWKESKLGEIYQFKYGYFNNNPSDGGKYPVYGANGIIGGYSKHNAEDSIIIGHMGEYAGSVLWGKGKHFVTYNGIISTPKTIDLNSKFGYYLFGQLDIRKMCGGSGQPFLSYETLQRLDAIYPESTTEQSKIYSYFAEIDHIIWLHQRKHNKLVTLKKAMLKKMFPQNGAAPPEIRFKGFSQPWEEKKLGEEVIITMGQSPSGANYTNNPADFVLVQGNADMKNGYVTPRVWTTQVTKTANAGDLILSVRAPVGEVGKTEYDVVLGRGVAGIKGNEFIFQSLSRMNEFGYWRQFSSGSTFDSINSEDLREAVLFIPSKDEQQKIGTYFRQLDELIAQHGTQVEKLKQIKTASLERMFV